jgi:hypothetical protein
MDKILISSFTWMNLIVSLKYYNNKVVVGLIIESVMIYLTPEKGEKVR